MLNASVDALCEVVSRISSDLGAALEADGGGDMEPTCLAADSLSSLLGDHCKITDPSPVSLTAEREMTAVTVLRDAAAASMRRSEVCLLHVSRVFVSPVFSVVSCIFVF